jgi:hypothetical protein
MNHPTGDERETEVVRLTKVAFEAAQAGQWDVVIQCYQDRGALLESAQQPVHKANDLLKLDEQIRDRARTAQVLLVSLLGEAAATKQRLHGLHQRLGGQPSTAGAVSMKA